MVNIISHNVHGLHDNIERQEIFHYYRTKASIICLQETHSSIEQIDETLWSNEWGGKIFFHMGTLVPGEL